MAFCSKDIGVLLDSGDTLLVEAHYMVGQRKRSISFCFVLVSSNALTTDLSALGEALTKALLKERLLPILHISVQATRLLITVYPKKQTQEPRIRKVMT